MDAKMTLFDWVLLALATVYVLGMSFLLVQHVRRKGDSALIGAGRLGALWALGTILIVLGGTLPIGPSAEDLLSLSGLFLMLGAFVAHWWLRSRKRG